MREQLLREVSAQATILALAGAAWAWIDRPTWFVFVAAYLVAWAVVGKLGLRLARWSAALVFAIPMTWLANRGDALLDEETIRGTPHHVADRLRLERLPSIAPALVMADRPQRFYVHAPNASAVQLRLGARGRTLGAESLGSGLFRFAYDPRRDGQVTDGEETQAQVIVDGTSHTRTLEHVRPTVHPRWFCSAPDGNLAATPSEETDELIVVRPDGSLRRIAVGDGPSDCAFVSPTRVWVSHRWGPTLWLIDVESERVVRRIPIGAAHRLAADGSRVAVALEREIIVLDSLTEVARVPVAADWVAWSDATLYASTVRPAALVRARASDGWELSAPLLLGRPVVTMSAAPGGVVIATTDYRADGRPHAGNHFVQDQLLHVADWGVTRQTLTTRRSPRQGSAGNIDRSACPMGIEAHPDGTIRVAFAGTDEAWRIAGDAEPVMELLPDVPAPHGIVSFASGAWSVSSPSAGVIATRTPEGWRVEELDESESSRRRGERNFYEATRSGVSCQSCHLHAHTDFVMRNIGGQRLAPTLSVRGVAATSPYLRDASYPRLRDLDHLSQTLLRGFVRPARRGEDLEAYVRSLPRIEPEPNEDVERERRGVEAFVRARCPTCHAFPAFTNLAQVPLGTLFPERLSGSEPMGPDEVLDVPSLLSVSTHGPWLSDGRANSILEVLRDHNGANRHGDTDALSESELADLVYFLEGL